MPRIRLFRRAVLSCIAINLFLIVVRVVLYRPLLTMPGAILFIAEPAIALMTCGIITIMTTSSDEANISVALSPAATFGLFGGGLLVVHMSLEDFGKWIGENALITLVFMIATFLLWIVSGFL